MRNKLSNLESLEFNKGLVPSIEKDLREIERLLKREVVLYYYDLENLVYTESGLCVASLKDVNL